MRYTGTIFLTFLIWWPIIVNSQVGAEFWALGINWKADNLDNTMFWIGTLFVIISGSSEAIRENREDKRRNEYR